MAEGGYRGAVVFDCQKKANKKFFEDHLPNGIEPLLKEHWPSNMPRTWTGTVYDITGFDGQQVVALLSTIVNDKDQFKKGKTFYLLIRNSSEDKKQTEYEPLYRLKANPTKHQPGNGIVVLRPKGKVRFTGAAKTYDVLNGALKAHYETNTTSFAKDIKKLLKGNAQNKDIPEATIEAYMILLFEIARRLAKAQKPSQGNDAFANLPIGSAIARLISLLEKGNYHFEEVFLEGKPFHCFSGRQWVVRRKAIEAINEATAKKETVTEKMLLKELQALFCSDQRLQEISSQKEDQLAKTSKDFKNMSLNEALSDAESYTAFDHCE